MSTNREERPYFPTGSCPLQLLGAVADVILIVGTLVLAGVWAFS